MFTILRLSVLVIVTLLTATCRQNRDGGIQTSGPDVEAISAQLDTIAAVSIPNTPSTDKSLMDYLALFTDDAVVMSPKGPAVIGKDQALSYYRKVFSPYLSPKLEYILDAVEVSGALGVRRYRGRHTFIRKSTGQKVRSAIKYVDVLRKQPDGTWKIALHVWAYDRPGTSPPQ